MTWVVYAIVAAVALAAADVFVKLAAGKLPDSLGMLLYGAVPFITGVIWYAFDRSHQSTPPIQPRAVAFAVAVDLMFAVVTFVLYAAFRENAPISILSPSVRLGGLLVASVVGFVLWKETLTLRYLLGLALACSGVYLIITR